MPAFLYGLVAWALSGLIPRLLVGAGLTLVVFAGVGPVVESLLDSAAASLTGLPSAAVQLALLSGVGTALSILGSAILSRIALTIGSSIAGLKVK